MDPTERARLVRVALEVVVGDGAEQLEALDQGDFVLIRDAGDAVFGVWVGDEAQGDDPPPFLEHAIGIVTDELTESALFWGMRLPLCPVHPDAHALAVRVGSDRVECVCPAAGVVREVPR